MAASLQGAPVITWIIQSDFGLESVPLDYHISSRTKSCAGDSHPEENVSFSGKLSDFLVLVFFPQPSKATEEAFIMWLLFREQILGTLTRAPALLPSFLPKEDPACWVKRERKVKGKEEVKEKATFETVAPGLEGKVDLERRMCVAVKSKLCHIEWIHQNPCWM